MLYPYRPSSVKNRQRWNFGVLYPPAWCQQQSGSDRSCMQTECLLQADSSARLTVKVRFLQIVQRTVGKLRIPIEEPTEGEDPAIEFVDCFQSAERVYQPWQEAVEREVTWAALQPESLSCPPLPFSLPQGKTFEFLRNEQGLTAAVIVREWKALTGSVEILSERYREGVFKITVRVHNLSGNDVSVPSGSPARDAVLLDSLVSAHTILGAENGEFLSLLEPPEGFELFAAQCQNFGTWPVLAGDDATGVLSSPIILYDYPQIAPESAGNLFDSTEIDEILSLRILTLTDAEKNEMRQSDERTRGILERTENMPEEQFLKLHGVLRGLTVLKEERQ